MGAGSAAVAHGDLGFSIAYNAPVAPLLWSRALNTLLLAVTAMLLTWIIGVPVGVWSAAYRGRWFDRVVEVGNSLLISVPEIVIALGTFGAGSADAGCSGWRNDVAWP